MSEPIHIIRPSASYNALTFIGLGGAILVVSWLLWLADLSLPTAAYAILWISSAACILLGLAKYFEPTVSVRITPQTFTYENRRGHWQLQWDNIIRVDNPAVTVGLNREELPYLAIRVYDLEPVLQQTSLRLLSQLLVAQRHLLTLALRYERPDLTDYSDYFAIPERYAGASGQVYRGLQAMFAMQAQHLRELLGYDLYIHSSALDRPLEEFVPWLRQLQATRHQHR